jgi:hypothetical protein
MSYIKNVIVRDLTILGQEGEIAKLGDNITTVLSIDYYESIFEPTFTFELTLVSNEDALTNLKLRGTETVSIEIEHQSGTLEFDDLILTSFVQNESVSTSNIFSIILKPLSIVENEKNRLTQKYDNTIKASTHVENILKSNLKIDEDSIEVEETANNDGFFGNYWRPFKGLYWLARRAVSASMPEDGGGTDRVGFLFWQTKSCYKFKSIDTMITDGKNDDVFEYIQNDTVSDNPNFDIYNPSFEYDQDIIGQMNNSMYGENRSYFNVHTLQVTKQKPFSKSNAKQAHLGDEEIVDLDEDINDNPTRVTRVAITDFTQRTDGTIDSGEGDYHPHKVISQSRMRYESLLSRSLRITVPCNIKLEAGDVILVKLIKTMAGNDEWLSGYYLIKDLRHTVHFTDTGVQCYTYLRLVRDTPGDA